MNSGYYQKYLKYKGKYLDLVDKFGGADNNNSNGEVVEETTVNSRSNNSENRKLAVIEKLDEEINSLNRKVDEIKTKLVEVEKSLGQEKANLKSTQEKLHHETQTLLKEEKEQEEIEIADEERKYKTALLELEKEKRALSNLKHKHELFLKQTKNSQDRSNTAILVEIQNKIHDLQLDKSHLVSEQNAFTVQIKSINKSLNKISNHRV